MVDLCHVTLSYDETTALTSLSWCNSRGVNSIDRFHSRDQKLGNRRYAAILVDQKCKQTRLHASCEYGILLDGRLWHLRNKSTRDKGLHFSRVPSVVTNQGEEAEKLSKERRSLWMIYQNRYSRTIEFVADISSQEKQRKVGTDLTLIGVPTLNLGHEKRVERKNLEQASQRGQRANEKERKRKEQLDRERALAEEIAAKKLKLNKAGEQVSSICFTNEVEQSVDSSTQTEEFDYLVNTGPLPL